MKYFVAMLAVVGLSACGPNYSNGTRVGIVTKLSEKGLIFKSWEGEMLMALPTSVAGTTQPEKFAFNADLSVVPQLQTAIQEGERVELVYRQWCMAPPTIDNDHVIVDVRKVTR